MVDASVDHVGAALQQRPRNSGPWQPLGFFSKKLDPAQRKYSAFDRELYACYAGIRHFRYMLEGRKFTIFTDHKPLTQALHRTSDPWTARQCRQLPYIAEFTSDVQHISGKENIVADRLSRPPPPATVRAQQGTVAAVNTVGAQQGTVAAVAAVAGVSDQLQPGLDFAAIAERQLLCPETQQLLKSSSLQVRAVPVEGGQLY
jgi:RNase H-like domain found in reverse transcriptase